MIMLEIKKKSLMRKLDNKIAVTTEGSRGVGFATVRRNFVKTAGVAASATLLSSRLHAKGKETFQNAGPSQAQKAPKIVMVPKFTGTAYFAATEKGAKEAVAELKGKGADIDFLLHRSERREYRRTNPHDR
jgi:hypothetical protein